MNYIYKIFEETSWRPTYYAVADYSMINNYVDDVCNIDSEQASIGDMCQEYWLKDNKKSL